jgi:hypothetical protein
MAIELQTNIALETQPTDPAHLVNVQWVEEFFRGKIKMPVRLVATANIAGTYTAATHTLDVTAAGHLNIDSVAVAVGNRVLLTGQTAGTQNGVYTVEDTGNGGGAELKRASDFDDSSKLFTGVTLMVNEGTQHAATQWKLATTGTIILDTTALEFIPVTPVQAASKYAEDIQGDNTETDFEVEHELGTTDVAVTVRNLTTQAMVLTDVTVEDADTVIIGFADPPTPAQHYRVVVMG